MGKERTPDFSGWATRNNLRCADGRIIRAGAFADQDGSKVPLLWNHAQGSPDMVLGHAILHNKADGVWADCFFNGSSKAKAAKEAILHGDVDALSIYANGLKQDGPNVHGGKIRELSLVLAGANPGAFIESIMCHGLPLLEDEDEGQIYTGEPLVLYHSEDGKTEDDSEDDSDEETVQDVLDTLTPKQKRVVNAVVGMALEEGARASSSNDEDEKDEEEDNTMGHNAFENNGAGQDMSNQDMVLCHSDVQTIMSGMKIFGSLRESWNKFVADRDAPILMHNGIPVVGDDGVLMHAGTPEVPTKGMDVATGTQKYGFNDASMFYPDARNMTNTPEFIMRRQEWVTIVLGGVHHTPFSRVKSMFANITEDEARAKGYIKGKQKKTEVFSTLKRVTNPTTIYKLQKLDRDDIVDITDFDVVAWLRQEMKIMLDEEKARAILIGDGREPGTEEKISEECIRPIAKDVDLFNVKVPVNVKTGATNAEKAKALIDEVIRSRKNYRGTGRPMFFTTEDWLTEMLLLEDGIGHKLYKTEADLATTLRVSKIVCVEPMEGQTVSDPVRGANDKDLIGVAVNLSDYNVGHDRGGQQSMFDDFDIDFNQQKYLIEERFSGALVRPFSAMTYYVNESDPASMLRSTNTQAVQPPKGSAED